MTRDGQDELRARLREAAEAHQPDRARILARIERGRSEQAGADTRPRRRPVSGRLRVVGAAAGVAGVLAAGSLAIAAGVQEEQPATRVTETASPTTTPSPETATRPPVVPPPPKQHDKSTDDARLSGEPTRNPYTPPVAPPTPSAGATTAPLWSDGSVDPHSNEFWAQSNVTLKSTTDLTALTVSLRIAQTGGVSSTGAWRTLPEEDFALAVEERDGFLTYTWVLRQGRTVPAGEWVFAGQYDHRRGGRDAGADRYTATADAGSQRLSASGDFAPRGDD
ncbi:hypothetical protein ABZO31_02275 [Streptomyces sp. HUAS MG47]|uniref:hypothetical protein n=1 Tax=Streptomyces solicamelliae TaxID=3231716 RepID=UPI003877C07A